MRLKNALCLLVLFTTFGSAGIAGAADSGQPIMVDSQKNFEATVSGIKGAMESAGLSIIFEANHQNMIAMVGGSTTPSITIGFARPQLGQSLLSIEPLAGIEMPMRIAIRELENGQVKVIYYQPSALFEHYNNPGLQPLAERMDGMIGMLVRAGTQ